MDLIDRQAEIEAVYKNDHRTTIKQRLDALPSAQPEIIHCMDCKYWHSGSCEYPERVVNCQDYYVGDIETEAEHFCGYAERRADG